MAEKDSKLKSAGVSGYNKPKRTPNHKTKSHVVVAKVGDQVKTKIRLYGIDAPERDQAYYRQAKDALAGMTAGQTVGVAVVEQDQYGRTVGTIYLDGKNINRAMVQRGYAWWYRRYAKYNRPLQEAEKYAQAQKLGLWSDPDPIPPWEWRRGRN